ncbi:cell wall-active antibiotics response protein LiaF [Kroppenstedtia eburnea]|uniref:Predicted membrane protein n=1 Tax=Kroppenstedtia eburnea TaxID=714067 RepID=A0A1N7Q6R3_9BACL|nr:cell wall-active antibiotics response protein LiaF [Kroppenstedtia eburnea]QKI83192.1 cell wall-active antibiotics response protein [Kroppenstedtia eburnea]SIT18399.1 Predicted membrane protein [Kroppenstedtia eburnea]
MQTRHRWNRLIVALLVIGAGTLFLLDNFYVIDISPGEIIADFWPLILVYFGLVNLLQSLRGVFDGRRICSGELLFGLLLLFLGANFLAMNLGFPHVSWLDIWKLWPLILIYLGIRLLLSPRIKSRSSSHSDQRKGGQWYRHEHGDGYEYNLFGEINVGKVPFSLENKHYWVGFGSIDLNLTQAIIPNGETLLRANGMFGSINVYLPSQLPTRVNGLCQLGSIDIMGVEDGGIIKQTSFQSPDFEEAEQRLVLDLSMVCGEIRVVRV